MMGSTHISYLGAKNSTKSRRAALRFIVTIGVVSFFADFTYEGSRGIVGPYLGQLHATGTIVGVVSGAGELLGYSLRLVSGRWADASRRYWPIAILGYIIQMASVPALALTGNWPTAAALIILERIGKAIRNPPRDVMLSYAGKQVGGYGWAFGLHEALDQSGAMFGPIVVAAVLAHGGDYHAAFAVLLVPALVNISLVLLARRFYPTPEDMEPVTAGGGDSRLPRVYWLYLAGTMLVAAGFADYPLIAFHFSRGSTVSPDSIPIFYAVAMATSGTGSLVFGRLFDRAGFRVLIVLTLLSALFAPLVFLGNFEAALLGAAIWGLGMGVHESIMPAAVTPMVAQRRRASAYGLFTAFYGISWFVGSALIGILYDLSLTAVVAFCVTTQLAALPIFMTVARRRRLVGAK
jgi:predicted MFS family arabinose efflux permease